MSIPCILFCILIHFLFSDSDAVSFSISHFDPGASNILYEGDAIPSNGAIELINLVDYTCRVGRATYAERVPLWDPSTGILTDFTTRFSFTIDTLNANNNSYGHGLAFFLGPVGYQIPPNSDNAYLGLVNTSAKVAMSKMPVVFVEFDSFVNKEWDPPMQHVGINSNSIYSALYASWDAGSYSGKTANVLIAYNATTKNLSVFWTYEENPVFLSNSSLSYHIDLMQVLPPWITVGFSAATGQFTERNTINSWEFTSSLVPVPEDQIRKKKLKLKPYWIAVIVVGCILLALGVVACLFVRNRRFIKEKLKGRPAGASVNTALERGDLPKRFSYEVLAKATNGFASDRKLGEGGSGRVYKGALSDLCCLVAVKKVFAESESLFINEVEVISTLRHRNLVQFLGWCHERGEFLLVYEYMDNGSLYDHLFGSKRPLEWNLRYNTMLALASALKYLHEDAEECILHRDIKPENIVLRSDFTAKVCDFGIAKLVDTQLKTERTVPVGTPGYLAPEYQKYGRASKESDMFSFGVVALEIASGKRNHKKGATSQLVTEIWTLYKQEKILDAADKRLKNFDSKEMECLMIVGLWCTHPTDKERPSARRVIQYLNFEAELPKLPSMMHDPVFPYNSDVDGSNTR